MNKHKVLILGITGMLGHTLFRDFARNPGFAVTGTARRREGLDRYFTPDLLENVVPDVDAFRFDTVRQAIETVRPDTVINCIGIIKQLKEAYDPVTSIAINALFPHQLAQACAATGSRVIHISTDCVFSGQRGHYTEEDPSDAVDLYGRTKFLGELHHYDHAVTLRTSIIGHELDSRYGLIEWFLAQQGQVNGFTRAIYTGFPTVEMAAILARYVIPNPQLKGLYQVASSPIDKYTLLKQVAQAYGKAIVIQPEDQFFCDRSLNGRKFADATGYVAPNWPVMVQHMHRHFFSSSVDQKQAAN
jgi:dTDP-4-dehydrorhamnose reductase